SIKLMLRPFRIECKGCCSGSGDRELRKADGWQSLAERPSDQIIDLATDAVTSSCWISRQHQFQHKSRRHQCLSDMIVEHKRCYWCKRRVRTADRHAAFC